MNNVLRFPSPPPSKRNHEIYLSEVLALIEIELLDKDRLRCRVCETVWKGFENDQILFDRLECPKRCNTE